MTFSRGGDGSVGLLLGFDIGESERFDPEIDLEGRIEWIIRPGLVLRVPLEQM